MDNRSRDQMRMDRRLLDRPGWISPAELESQLAALPDVVGKIDDREGDPSEEAKAGASEPESASPDAPTLNSGADGANSGGAAGGEQPPSF